MGIAEGQALNEDGERAVDPSRIQELFSQIEEDKATAKHESYETEMGWMRT